MNKTLDDLGGLLAPLHRAQAQFATTFPGDSPLRQPVHTVYGGAQLFKSDTAVKLGAAARRHAAEYFPDCRRASPRSTASPRSWRSKVFTGGSPRSSSASRWRTCGSTSRTATATGPDAEEDAAGGDRPRPRSPRAWPKAPCRLSSGSASSRSPQELETRSIRTLDLFLTALADATGGKLPPNFVITLPKVTLREEVAAFVALLESSSGRSASARAPCAWS